MAEDSQTEVRTVSLYAEDWLEVDTLARASGAGRSGAMRRIIREWREMHDPMVTRKASRLRQLAESYAVKQLTQEEFAREAMLLGLNGEASRPAGLAQADEGA